MKAAAKKWRAYMHEKRVLVNTKITEGMPLHQARIEARNELEPLERDIRHGDNEDDRYVALIHPTMWADLKAVLDPDPADGVEHGTRITTPPKDRRPHQSKADHSHFVRARRKGRSR